MILPKPRQCFCLLTIKFYPFLLMCTNAFGDVPIGLSLSYRTKAEYKMWF
jgi:hypothetical protein